MKKDKPIVRKEWYIRLLKWIPIDRENSVNSLAISELVDKFSGWKILEYRDYEVNGETKQSSHFFRLRKFLICNENNQRIGIASTEKQAKREAQKAWDIRAKRYLVSIRKK